MTGSVKSAENKKVVVSSPYKNPSVFGPQGQRLIPMITQEMCGTTGLSACMVYMPPGRIAKPHYHARTDIIVVVIEGVAASLIGENLKPVFHGPGEFIFIPEGVAHVAVNLSRTKRLIAIEMRTDPKFNEDVIALPEHNEKTQKIVDELHAKFEAGELKIPDHIDLSNLGPFRFAELAEDQLL